jgi:hypothetical protein
MAKGHLPGGGIASNKNVEVRVRTGAGSREVRPAGTNAPGSSYGSHVTNQSDPDTEGEVLRRQKFPAGAIRQRGRS